MKCCFLTEEGGPTVSSVSTNGQKGNPLSHFTPNSQAGQELGGAWAVPSALISFAWTDQPQLPCLGTGGSLLGPLHFWSGSSFSSGAWKQPEFLVLMLSRQDREETGQMWARQGKACSEDP